MKKIARKIMFLAKYFILVAFLNLIQTCNIQSSSEFEQFVDPMAIPITGKNEWKNWTGSYYPNKGAFLKNSQTHKIVTFTDIHIGKRVINTPKKLLIEFATMPNPNGNQNLFSNELSLFSPHSPKLILSGKENG